MPEPFTAAAARLPAATTKALRQAADRLDKLATQSASRTLGGDAVIRFRRGSTRLGTRIGTASSERIEVEGDPRGVWNWIEGGTKPHTINPTSGDHLAGDLDHPVRGSVRHPGTAGDRAWTRAVDGLRREFPDIVKGVFRG